MTSTLHRGHGERLEAGRGGRWPHPHRLQALRRQGGKRKCRDTTTMTAATAAAAAVTDTRAGWGRRGDSRGGGGGQGATPNPLALQATRGKGPGQESTGGEGGGMDRHLPSLTSRLKLQKPCRENARGEGERKREMVRVLHSSPWGGCSVEGGAPCSPTLALW